MKNSFKIFRWGLSILILILLFWKVGLIGIITSLSRIKLIYFILSFMIIPFIYGLACMNISLGLIYFKKLKIPFLSIYTSSLIVQAFSLFIPGRLGTFSWGYFLRGNRLNIGETSSIVLIDSIISFLTSAILALIGVFIFFGEVNFYYFLILILLFLFLLSVTISSTRIRKYFGNLCFKFFRFRLDGFYKTFILFIQHRKEYLIINFILTFMRWFFTGISVLLLFLSLNYPVKLGIIIIVGAITVLMSLIPITLNGIGLRESLGVYLYGLAGVPLEISTAVFILTIIQIYLFGILSLILIDYNRIRENILPYLN